MNKTAQKTIEKIKTDHYCRTRSTRKCGTVGGTKNSIETEGREDHGHQGKHLKPLTSDNHCLDATGGGADQGAF